MTDDKRFAPACERNREPILAILESAFQSVKTVLEIGSGTGQHAVYFARNMPWLMWQPSDLKDNLTSIQAWSEEAGLGNLLPALELDVDQGQWPQQYFDAIFTANTLHIMSWNHVQMFMQNAAGRLNLNGYLGIYGPLNYNGQYTSSSNAQFDQWLKQQSQHSAIRNFEDMCVLAGQHALQCQHDHAMPANNRLLLFRKTK
ncbi:MAG: DUF938 domain-containing protein [Gammaproteobacteria bacterium]|nr:DUF938 domain-containing protein [Gammaproteobacteria bacterium]